MTMAWTLFVASAVIAQGPAYGPMRAEAKPMGNLGRFLENFLGDCLSDDPEFDAKACEDEAARFRKLNRHQTYLLEVDDVQDNVHFGGWDKRRRAFRLHVTPFFSGRELAITVGKPKARKKDGLPEVPNVPVWVKLPKDQPEFVFRRQLERGMVRLELVIEPKTTWALRRRGSKGYFRGLSVKLKGLRMIGSRSDRVLAEQTYP